MRTASRNERGSRSIALDTRSTRSKTRKYLSFKGAGLLPELGPAGASRSRHGGAMWKLSKSQSG